MIELIRWQLSNSTTVYPALSEMRMSSAVRTSPPAPGGPRGSSRAGSSPCAPRRCPRVGRSAPPSTCRTGCHISHHTVQHQYTPLDRPVHLYLIAEPAATPTPTPHQSRVSHHTAQDQYAPLDGSTLKTLLEPLPHPRLGTQKGSRAARAGVVVPLPGPFEEATCAYLELLFRSVFEFPKLSGMA
jgi:hypothetical protein